MYAETNRWKKDERVEKVDTRGGNRSTLWNTSSTTLRFHHWITKGTQNVLVTNRFRSIQLLRDNECMYCYKMAVKGVLVWGSDCPTPIRPDCMG